MKTSVFIATSLDGYIATVNGDVSWLMDKRYELEGEGFGYQELYDSCELLVLGRRSYEKVASFETWPYPDKRVIVLSQSLCDDEMMQEVELSAEGPQPLVKRLEAEGVAHIYIDGGALISSFLDKDLVSEMTLTTIPILLGEGIALFSKLSASKHLKLITSKGYSNGFVQSCYTLNK